MVRSSRSTEGEGETYHDQIDDHLSQLGRIDLIFVLSDKPMKRMFGEHLRIINVRRLIRSVVDDVCRLDGFS